MGVSEAVAQAWLDTQEAPEDPVFSVWSCNWPALRLFLGLKTQWRRAPFGGVIGLEYSAIPAFLRLRGIKAKRWPNLFEKFQAMEAAAVPIMNGK